jgi:HAE1 family hydrophobic/amphiphilic exporter-1
MPVDLYPDIDIPYAVITTVYPGAGPEEIETLVSKPIEDAVISTNGLKNLISYSQEGISNVSLEFELGTDLDAAMADVRSKVDAIRRQLPQDAEPPVIQKLDVGAFPVLWLGISSKRPARELRELADDVIKDRLGKIAGVGAVTVTGGDIREIQVNVDKNRLEAYGLTINQIVQALSLGNLNLPSGRITEGRREYAVRAVGEFRNLDEIKNMRIHLPNGANLTIGDIAEVKDSCAEREETTRVQKKDSIGLLVQKQPDANTVEVVAAVKKELEAMKDILPKDVEIAIALDQSTQVKEALSDVNVSLWLGAFLAVVIVFLFLHNIRGTFIVAIAIPTSIIATFIPIYFAGFTMNMMVMLALSLAVGILVDDSIVVLENIYRHLAKGEEPAEAAFNGRTEIGLAAITITMVDVVVFVPIAFMGGIVGQFFRQFGLTVATATLFSLLASFTLTPMLASRWYRKGEAVEATTGFFAKFDRFYHALDTKYRTALAWALSHRRLVVGTGFGSLLVVLLFVAPRLGFEFAPRIDQKQVGVTIEMPVGSSLAATDSIARQVEDIFSNIPEVESIFTNVGSTQGGRGAMGERGANYAQVMGALKEKESVLDSILRPFTRGERKRTRSDQEIAQEIRAKVASIPGGRIKVQVQSGMGRGGSPIDIELTGADISEINAAAQKVREVVANTPGILNTDVSWKVGKPEIKATIDRVRAAELGLTVGQIASALRTSIDGSTESRFRQNGKEYDIRVRLTEFDRHSVSDVGRVVVGSINHTPIYLQDVAQITPDTGPTKIERKNRERKVSVIADLAPGYHLGNVQRELKQRLSKVDLGNVRLHWAGEAEQMRESFGHLISALLLAVALVYMLMAALFESLLNPFIIMFSLPMALVGALLALAITGETLSIVSMIGFIMLMGLVTKNAILLIDYTNTLRQRGMERNEAILEAGPTRLRPILMTTLAMVFGMLPTALKLGRGSEMRAPMAIAVIGGLIVSTLLTLLVIPTLYAIFDDWVAKWHDYKKKILGRLVQSHKEPVSETEISRV